MKSFEELDRRAYKEIEKSIHAFWDEHDILQKSIKNREGKENFVFYDGPATANGYPGLHHMVAKFLKDSFCKYKTMQGYRVLRKVGWDTHGLPVELEVEKELGFQNKSDIEQFGIQKFNDRCRETVMKNESLFVDLTKKMGQFIDVENGYVTYHNDYIESVWWILKRFFEEGYIYEGNKILPYCPRCQTGLASHEVAQGYEEVDVDTVTVTVKKKDEDCYFLVWTTTPWTLLSNVALCVNPLEEYVKVSSKGYQFILAAKLANRVLGDDYEVLETYIGKDLEYMEYEQLLPFLPSNKKAFFVTCADYVTMDDGTGIVHIAPAFGEDDNQVGKQYNLPSFNPVGEDGCYTEGPWAGMLIFDADKEVIAYLKTHDKLFKKQKMSHNYPHCWRCHTPLVYYSKPSYYVEVTKMKDQLIYNNNKINWYPAYVGEKRFGNWLENLNDWAISRNRYWGTPLPLWRCDTCGHEHMIGSKEELIELAHESIDETIDLHRPYVDDVHITCSKCHKRMTRVPDVIDVWFDSGSMPFAQYHYPFENIELFDDQFPADFICEGIDQTRGWFYVLLVISTFIKGVSPFKNVLVNDLLLDMEGKKMSKSKGNIVEPFSAMEEYSADAVRWYLPYVSPVWTPLKFDTTGLKEVYSKFFNPLKNTYNFFCLYANTDHIDIQTCNVSYEDLEEIDQWLLSKYHRLLQYVTESFEEYDLHKIVRSITDFVSEDLSNWYIRRNRKRFWKNEFDMSKQAVYQTTYQVLVGVSQMIAPIIPYLSEEIYQKLTGEFSVHTSDFPCYDASMIDDAIEQRMDLVRELISIGRYVREETKIKVRQPISEAILDGSKKEWISDSIALFKEELNVKKIHFTEDLSTYMNFLVKPNFKVAGPIFGSNIKAYATSLQNLSTDQIHALRSGDTIDIVVDNVEYMISADMVDIRIESKEGFNVGMEKQNFVILNTELSQELIEEGLAREVISKVQQLRKNKDFDISDRILLSYHADEEVNQAITNHMDYIKDETLSVELRMSSNLSEVYDINGHEVFLQVEQQNK